ncbi:late embryogenesis abundant protein 3-like [Vigna umbellata]|uniref:late embryogenesis abundant protein 3-like n=1 Tax=Vigna umbellata TaxID=87088 RepID=UPI001F5FB01F|nr:late embryogenesis abundant protein 3-like [Vigna umbellata]
MKHSNLIPRMSHQQLKKPQADLEISNYGDFSEKTIDRLEPVVPTGIGSAAIDGDPITIGEALEAAAIAAGNKAVDQNDAAAIRAAEIRASGEKSVRSGGVGETAQAAATFNSHVKRNQDKTKLSDILTDASEKLSVDKAVTKEDADAVYAAEVQFTRRGEAEEGVAKPGGVSASMATAANLNQQN